MVVAWLELMFIPKFSIDVISSSLYFFMTSPSALMCSPRNRSKSPMLMGHIGVAHDLTPSGFGKFGKVPIAHMMRVLEDPDALRTFLVILSSKFGERI